MNTKILIIDDNEAILDSTRRILEFMGFEVDTATDPVYISSMEKDFPDLILLDIMLANADGREVCKNIKQNEKIKHIPVIMLSAQSEAEVKEAAVSSGAHGYILKPYRIDEMVEVIRKNL